MTECTAPILFLVFNRPETTARVHDSIRHARPRKLYVAADGPRDSRPGEREVCAEVRRIATEVDWPCTVETLLRDRNLGCRDAVSSAIDWFFEREPEGIVLEDDILPLPSFFAYACAMLERYRDDPRVMMINGSNVISHRYRSPESYFFSSYAHVWGWASWRRAWRHYDVGIRDWPEVRARRGFASPAATAAGFDQRWNGKFESVYQRAFDTWDYQWSYEVLKRGGLATTPRTNLVHNLGFGAEATHTIETLPDYLRAAVTADLEVPLSHPAIVERDTRADRIEERFVQTPPWQDAWLSWAIKTTAALPGGDSLLRSAKTIRRRLKAKPAG